jgi:hypothetical protein
MKQFGTSRADAAAKMSIIISWRRGVFPHRVCSRPSPQTATWETQRNCALLRRFQAVIRCARAACTAMYFNKIAVSAGLLDEITSKA